MDSDNNSTGDHPSPTENMRTALARKRKQQQQAQSGHLLLAEGYLEEVEAATAIGVSLWTLTGYRKKGIGPPYTIVRRAVFYHPDELAAWLRAGGLRESA